MKEIKIFEDAIRNGAKSLKELGINHTLFWAYTAQARKAATT